MIRFIIFFLVNMSIMYYVFSYQQIIDIQYFYTNIVNMISIVLINFIGIEASQWGIDIILPMATLRVAFGCNGLEAILIFSAGVLAYKATSVEKRNWLIKGIIFLSLINIIRIVVLAYVLRYHLESFNFMHDYITQDLMIFLAIILFLIFVNKIDNMDKSYAKK